MKNIYFFSILALLLMGCAKSSEKESEAKLVDFQNAARAYFGFTDGTSDITIQISNGLGNNPSGTTAHIRKIILWDDSSPKQRIATLEESHDLVSEGPVVFMSILSCDANSQPASPVEGHFVAYDESDQVLASATFYNVRCNHQYVLNIGMM